MGAREGGKERGRERESGEEKVARREEEEESKRVQRAERKCGRGRMQVN